MAEKEKITIIDEEINKDLEETNPYSLIIRLLQKIEENTRPKV